MPLALSRESVALSSAPPSEERRSRVMVTLAGRRTRDAICDALSREGYEIFPMCEADQFFSAAAETSPDLVLLDFDDVIAGQVCVELTSIPNGERASVILVRDGIVDEERAASGFALGADDVVDARRLIELRARVRVQLRNKRGIDALERTRKERHHLLREASLDPLTQILNRPSLSMAMERFLAKSESFSLVFLELDHMQSVIGALGQGAKDATLRALAEWLRAQVRTGDVCGRWTGEQLAVLVRGATEPVAQRVAERYRAAVSALTVPALRGRRLTVSIGVATFNVDKPDPSATALSRRADLALYDAKRNGHDRVCVAPPFVASSNIVALRRGHDDDLSQESLAPESVDPTERELLSQLASGRAWLPVLPEACERALSLAHDETVDLSRVAAMVDKDPAIAARFLSAANSAFYARAKRTSTTLGAVVTLGLTATRDLLFQVVYESARRGPVRFRAQITRSFEKSLVSAHACRMIARELGMSTEYSYLAGLLHDLGEARIYRILSVLPGTFKDDHAEALVLRHHAQAGADLATAWKLPDEIRDACALHHEDPAGAAAGVCHVIIADVIAALITSGRATRNMTAEERELVEKAGAPMDRLEAVTRAARTASGRDSSRHG
jgi:diguanylate cyclase (GGDEF)-like protein/putative nucleotidyltransferase with HDIG domain